MSDRTRMTPTPKFFASPTELRRWLAAHHDTERELWIGFYKRDSGKGGITYPEALDEALCIGWIDGVRKSLDDESFTQRFSPRKPISIWSPVNIRRVAELKALGRMKAPGLAAFEKRDPNKSYPDAILNRPQQLDPPYEKLLKANKKAWAYFQQQPPSYRRNIASWIASAVKEETRLKRLTTLIDDCAHERWIAGMPQSKRKRPSP